MPIKKDVYFGAECETCGTVMEDAFFKTQKELKAKMEINRWEIIKGKVYCPYHVYAATHKKKPKPDED